MVVIFLDHVVYREGRYFLKLYWQTAYHKTKQNYSIECSILTNSSAQWARKIENKYGNQTGGFVYRHKTPIQH